MANTKPSAFTVDATPDDTDWVPYIDKDQGGAGVHANRILTFSDLTAYFESRARVHNALTAALAVGATDTYALGVAVPAGRLQAKSKFKFEFVVSKTAVGTGTPQVNIRFGTAATTADASVAVITFPAANTAAVDRMKLTVLGTFKAVGSGTAASVQADMMIEHQLTTTGFGGTGTGANIIVPITGTGFNSTVANSILSCTINGSTGAVWTVHTGHALLENLA